MYTAILTSKGQVTIPAELRISLGLSPGDTLIFKTIDNKMLVSTQKIDIPAAFGMYQVDKKITLADIDKAIVEGCIRDSDNSD